MTEIRPNTPILDRINSPEDMKNLSDSQLHQLARELRSETISIVSETGGHLGAGLGVVELTTAIHAVFDTPKDRLIWDVSHQCYPHKSRATAKPNAAEIEVELCAAPKGSKALSDLFVKPDKPPPLRIVRI